MMPNVIISLSGMLSQVTVWFGVGLKHCWNVDDLMKNECPSLFPLDWPKCMHKRTLSFHFHIKSSYMMTRLDCCRSVYCVLCGDCRCHFEM